MRMLPALLTVLLCACSTLPVQHRLSAQALMPSCLFLCFATVSVSENTATIPTADGASSGENP